MSTIWLLSVDYTTGCESDATSTIIVGAFSSKELAEAAKKDLIDDNAEKNLYESEYWIDEMILDKYSTKLDLY